MKGDTYYLKTVGGDILGKFVVDQDDYFSVTGKCYEATSWDAKTGEVYSWLFHSGVYCKWDGCTHWNFKGEDYDPEIDGSEDSYYHLCGEYSFNRHIQLMCFVWKLVATLMIARNKEENNIQLDIEENYFELSVTKDLVELMLDGCTIELVGKES